MKILFLCMDIPSGKSASTVASYNFIKQLSLKHDITLVSFKLTEKEERYPLYLDKYCSKIEIVKLLLDDLTHTKKIVLGIQNMFSMKPFLVTIFYSIVMENKVIELIKSSNFDLIYVDGLVMAQFIPDEYDIPKIINPHDAESETAFRIAKKERSILSKIFFYLQYFKLKRYELCIYRKFNACIVVAPHDKKILKSYLPNLPIFVIPNGVDINYFRPTNSNENPLSTVFVGQMSHPPNVQAVMYFYKKIYPIVKEKMPDIKFYIVGRGPSKEIQSLAVDGSIIVTGYITDIRPYLNSASVAVMPITSGMGIKNKILEAMAMEKPVITTSMGAQGINVSSERDIIIADDPKEFALRLIELLNDEQLRKKIAHNGRRLVETNYSWEKMADMLNELFEEIARTNENT